MLPLCVLTCALLAPAAAAQYRFDHWTTDNGLPQNSVRHILQTRDGYLWLATLDGLVRFDGVRFTVFNKGNSPGLASNRFLSLFEDRWSDLWVTLETGGLVRRHQGRFTTFPTVEGLPLGSHIVPIEDADGNMVIGTMSRWFRWMDGQFQPFDDPSLTLNPLPEEWRDKGVVSAMDDDRSNIWFFTADRLFRARGGRVAQVYTEGDGLPGKPLMFAGRKRQPLQIISRDAAGRLWITGLDTKQNHLMSPQAPEGLDMLYRYGAYADQEGNYWFGSYNSGLVRARRQTVTAYGKAQGLNAREVYSLLESRDGSLWIGTWGDGLFRYKDGTFTSYAPGSYVASLYEDRAGRLWVNGTWRLTDGGFVQETWKGYAPELSGSIWTMCEDNGGAYWLGSEGGVFRCQNGVATRYMTHDGLAGNDTKVIINDTSDGLWLGSYGGLTHYRDGQFTAWTEKDGLPGSTVRALKQDEDGTLWIGTYDSGLGRFKDGRFTRYTTKDGLYDDGVFQILEDDFGWFWMSCNRGIYRVRKQDLDDFADGKIRSIVSLSYNKNDGMLSAECNGGRWPAGCKTRDGNLWFPTMGGMAMIDPARIRPNASPPPVIIEAMRIDNTAVPAEMMASATAASTGPQSAIEIAPGQNNFEIDYTALSFINSENLRFKYKLEGHDSDWIEAGTRRTAYYSRVSPGAYTFRGIAANADGVWNEVGASLRITVVPPVYMRWWFMTLVGLSVAAGILLIFRMRERQLRQKHAQQAAFSRQLIESQEAERQRIAAELHDSLGQNLLIIKNRALLGLEPPPETSADGADGADGKEARAQLQQISDLSSQTLDEVREIAYNLRPYQIDRIGLSKAIEFMIRKIAETSPVKFVREIDRVDGCFTPEAEINLYRIVQEGVNNIVKHSGATEARIHIRRDDHRVRLVIEDNGKGFDAEPEAANDVRRGGFGLTGIAERARILGGGCAIRSAPGKGTVVEVTIDLQVENHADRDAHHHRR